ncbi:PleD family two-component system response regulator [Cognatishimia sp. MH4019]|uniref:response regulator n=1 Tax=Cognatishimia sp. MH4019 TaxID=2854030 RepID=UPI001CD3FC5F|nr:response regulator [Cognatishimia sp. MH4019]
MRILAVDDDPIILDLLTVALSTFGYDDIVTAQNGAEAIEILQSDQGLFDTLLYDIQMPVMDGIELVYRTRALLRYSDVPILMLTAMSEKTYIDRAFLAGATDYITKPFDTMELQARLKVSDVSTNGTV